MAYGAIGKVWAGQVNICDNCLILINQYNNVVQTHLSVFLINSCLALTSEGEAVCVCVCLPVCRVVGIFVSTGGGEDGTVGINTIANENNTTVIF